MKVNGEKVAKILTWINTGTIGIIAFLSFFMNPPTKKTTPSSDSNNTSLISFLYKEGINNSLLANNSETEEIEYTGDIWDSVYMSLFSACFLAACFLSLLYFSFHNEDKKCYCCSCCYSTSEKNNEELLAVGTATCCCCPCLCSDLCCCCCKKRGSGSHYVSSGGGSSYNNSNCDCSDGGGEGAVYACLLIVFLFFIVIMYFCAKDLGKSVSRKVGYIFLLLLHCLFIYLAITFDINEQIIALSYIVDAFGIIGVLVNIFAILFSFSAFKCCITIENPPNEESEENLVSYGETKPPEDIPSAEPHLNNNYNSEKKEIELSPYDTNQGQN